MNFTLIALATFWLQQTTAPPRPATVSYWDRLRVDYGKPTVQFEAVDLGRAAEMDLKKYQGQKVTVRGEVTKIDITDPRHCYVWMKHGIAFDFLGFKAAAEDCKIGEVVFIDGILKRHTGQGILLAPAFKRDPNAPFKAIKP